MTWLNKSTKCSFRVCKHTTLIFINIFNPGSHRTVTVQKHDQTEYKVNSNLKCYRSNSDPYTGLHRSCWLKPMYQYKQGNYALHFVTLTTAKTNHLMCMPRQWWTLRCLNSHKELCAEWKTNQEASTGGIQPAMRAAERWNEQRVPKMYNKQSIPETKMPSKDSQPN